MQLPKLRGVIGRRLLVNFRVEPDVVERLLPQPFRPKLHEGHAVAGICLIRLEEVRPKGLPRILGLSSENAAHRIAVRWEDDKGSREGVYIPRRDTGSFMNHLAGGRIFPGEHHRSTFRVEDEGDRIALAMTSSDGRVQVEVAGRMVGTLPATSMFRSIAEASAFFEPGSVGYSSTASGRRLDGVVLRTHTWSVAPMAVDHVSSTYFADESMFPRGTVEFDCALIMRNIEHEWHAGAPLYV